MFTFLTWCVPVPPGSRCLSRLSVQSHLPSHLVLSVASRDFTLSFQRVASEAKPLCQRGSPSALLLLFLGIIPPPLLSPFLGTSLQEQ